jgi:hypothetical protein
VFHHRSLDFLVRRGVYTMNVNIMTIAIPSRDLKTRSPQAMYVCVAAIIMKPWGGLGLFGNTICVYNLALPRAIGKSVIRLVQYNIY